jgi:hypothetical protein
MLLKLTFLAFLAVLFSPVSETNGGQSAESQATQIFRWSAQNAGRIRSEPRVNDNIVSSLHPGETYRVLETKHDKQTWLRLDIPTLATAWVGVAGKPPAIASLDNIADLSSFLRVSGKAQQGGAKLQVTVSDGLSPNILPINLFLLTGEKDSVLLPIGEIKSLGLNYLPLPSEVTPKKTILLLFGSDKSLSYRTKLKLLPATREPAVSIEPHLVEISPVILGEKEFDLSISCTEELELMSYAAPKLFATDVSFPMKCSGVESIPFRFNIDEWRQSTGKTRPINGDVVYRTRSGEEGKIPWQVTVYERWSWVDWAKYKVIPSLGIILLGLTTMLVGCFLTLRWLSQRYYIVDGKFSSEVLNKLGQLSQILTSLTVSINDPKSHFEGLTRAGWSRDELTDLRMEKSDLQKQLAEARANEVLSQQRISECERDVQILQQERDALVERHGAELGELNERWIAAEKLAKQLTTLRENYEKHFIFGLFDARSLLGELRRQMDDFAGHVVKLRQALQEMVVTSPGSLLAVRQIVDGDVGSFPLDKIQTYVSYMDELFSQGKSVFPELAAAVGTPRTLSAEECRTGICNIFYYNCIADRWDRVLRGLQRFYHLNDIVEFNAYDNDAHTRLVSTLKVHTAGAEGALRQIGIETLSISFLNRIAERVSPFIVYAEEQPIEEFYPRWKDNGGDRRGLVLDCQSWGYLNNRGDLWGHKKARLVMSK